MIKYDDSCMVGNETIGQRVAIQTFGGANEYTLQKGGGIRNCIITNCGTAVYDAGESCFSCHFVDLEITNVSYKGFEFTSSNRSGNVYSNIYIANPGDKFTNVINGFCLRGEESECTIIQLNVEHMTCNQAIWLENIKGLNATSIHIEGVQLKADYNGFIVLNKVSGQFGTVSFYFTRGHLNGSHLFTLKDSVASILNNEKSFIKIQNLNCKGLNRPHRPTYDYTSYPQEKETLTATPPLSFFFFFRESGYTDRDYFVELESYTWYTYTSVVDDSQKYIDFPRDPHGKILFTKLGQNLTFGTTAQRPTKRLTIGFRYFDTTLGKSIDWNGSVWKDSAGTTV
jgi:hypothetical protein